YPGVAPALPAVVVDPSEAKSATMMAAIAVAAVGAAIGVWLYGPRRSPKAAQPGPLAAFLAEGFYLDALYRGTVVPLAHGLARLGAQFLEPSVIDGAVNGLAGLVRSAAAGTRDVHTGYVRRYALGIVVGTIAVLVYMAML